MKTCWRCHIEKPLNEFHRNRTRPGGLAAHCKSCSADYVREFAAKNPTYHREWQARHKVPARDREQYLQRKYGLTSLAIDQMLASQGGLCGLCGLALKNERGPGRMAVDHDHATGRVRALLHAKCNVALGVVEVVGAQLFDAYLRRHQSLVA